MSDRMGDVDSRDVEAGGVRFHVLSCGPGPSERDGRATPALLLHGVPETSAMWRHLLPVLARDRMVFAPDLKGLGASEVKPPYDVATLTRELAALVEVVGGGRPVDVVGHDWGGVLAIALARARPDVVRRLVVANAPYRKLDLLHAAHIPFFALPVVPDLVGDAAAEQVVRAMLRLGWKAPEPVAEAALRDYVAAYAQPERWRAMLAYYRAAAWLRLARLLHLATPEPKRPARVEVDRKLVVWGALDPALPLPVGQATAHDLGSDTVLVTVPGAGHFVVEEAPDVVVPVIARFLSD